MSDQEFTKPAEIRSRQEKSFATLIAKVLECNEFYKKRYRSLDFKSGRKVGLSDLDKLPFVKRSDLVNDQQSHPPFGTNLTFPVSRYTRVHHSPGGLRWMDTEESWSWWLDCWKEAYEAASVTPDNHVFVACSVGPSIGFWTAFEAGQRLGALMIPGGTAKPQGQLEIMLRDQADVLVTTPGNAARLASAAALGGYDLASCSLRMILHSDDADHDHDAEDDAESAGWSGRKSDLTLSTELGAWAYGCGEGEYLHVNEAEFIVEVVDPHSGEVVARDDNGTQRGELVLTNLGRVGSPLIRYRTGQVLKLSRRPCACGRRTAVLEVEALDRAPLVLAL
jgi:phenylacetate-CoA ligase